MQDQQNKHKPLFSQEEEKKSPHLVEVNKNNTNHVNKTIKIPEEKQYTGKINNKHARWKTPNKLIYNK